MVPGVLVLQGSSEPHLRTLERLGHEPREVRTPLDLCAVTHLILPGGESTTIHHLLSLFGMWEALLERHRAGQLALFGTCAGAILLGRDDGTKPPRMELLDARLERNAFGRQIDSFSADLELECFPGREFHCVFIRAPRFRGIGGGARVLGRWNGEPILVEGNGLLAATFHPELTDDLRIHEYFLRMDPADASAGLRETAALS